MMVNELFPGKAFLPFQKDIGDGVAGSGPQRVVNHTLSNLADLIELPQNAQVAAPQARPNPLANMTSFVSDVLRVNRQLSSQQVQGIHRSMALQQLSQQEPEVYARYIEWMALSALVALRGVYSMFGLKLEMKSEALNAERYLFDRALLFALDNTGDSYRLFVTQKNPKTGQPTGGKLFYLVQDDQPFALYSDEIGACPMVHYPDVKFEGLIPWYRKTTDEHKSWADPLSCEIGDYAENRFKWWMERNGYKDAVDGRTDGLEVYNRCATQGGWQTPATDLLTLYRQNYADCEIHGDAFCKVCGGYLDNQNNPQLLPEFFTPELLLAYKTDPNEPSGLGYNDVTGHWNSLVLDGDEATRNQLTKMDCLVPTLPFTKAAAELYRTEFEIESLSFQAHAASWDALESVDMHASLVLNDIQRQVFSFTRTYPLEKIRGGVLPYLMVWPWIELPKNSWNRFYATQKQSGAELHRLCGEKPIFKALTLKLSEGTDYTVQERGNLTGAQQAWQVTCSDSRFRYAVISTLDAQEEEEKGMIIIPLVREFKPNPIPNRYDVSVDFGTTSTVCAIRDPAGKVDFLPYTEFGCNVTIGDWNQDISAVAERRWLGRSGERMGDTLLARKTLSAAQLFDCTPSDNNINMFVNGRFFLATSTQLCGYSPSGSFENQGIYNDLKLSTQNDIDKNHASILFLAGVYTQALLYVLSSAGHAGEISGFKVSYPGALTRSMLENCWYQAAAVVNDCLVDGARSRYALNPAVIQYCTEAQAAQRYIRQSEGAGGQYLNVDIGGGTTDLSVVLLNPQKPSCTLSFKYAGREVMINTFIQVYRHWKGDDKDQSMAHQHFTQIWAEALDPQMNEQRAEIVRTQLVDVFFKRCASMNKMQWLNAQNDETLRTLVEILLNDFDLQLPNRGEYNLLREIFSLKFFLLMRMVAKFMAQNPTERNQLLQAVFTNEGLQKNNLCISLTGTAAMTLQHVFNLPLSELQQLSSLDTERRSEIMLDKLAAMMSRAMGVDDLAVTLQISDNVREKQEVAFGMLYGGGGNADPLVQPNPVKKEEVIELFSQLEPVERRKWYRVNFGQPILANQDEQAQVQERIDRSVAVDLEKYWDDLSQKVTANKLSGEIAQLKGASDKLKNRIDQIFADWRTLGGLPITLTTWPTPAPINANVGFGKGVTQLNNILPKGIALSNAVNRALDNLQQDKDKMRYLSSIFEDEYREELLVVYLVEQIINQALYDYQKEDMV